MISLEEKRREREEKRKEKAEKIFVNLCEIAKADPHRTVRIFDTVADRYKSNGFSDRDARFFNMGYLMALCKASKYDADRAHEIDAMVRYIGQLDLDISDEAKRFARRNFLDFDLDEFFTVKGSLV